MEHGAAAQRARDGVGVRIPISEAVNEKSGLWGVNSLGWCEKGVPEGVRNLNSAAIASGRRPEPSHSFITLRTPSDYRELAKRYPWPSLRRRLRPLFSRRR